MYHSVLKLYYQDYTMMEFASNYACRAYALNNFNQYLFTLSLELARNCPSSIIEQVRLQKHNKSLIVAWHCLQVITIVKLRCTLGWFTING